LLVGGYFRANGLFDTVWALLVWVIMGGLSGVDVLLEMNE